MTSNLEEEGVECEGLLRRFIDRAYENLDYEDFYMELLDTSTYTSSPHNVDLQVDRVHSLVGWEDGGPSAYVVEAKAERLERLRYEAQHAVWLAEAPIREKAARRERGAASIRRIHRFLGWLGRRVVEERRVLAERDAYALACAGKKKRVMRKEPHEAEVLLSRPGWMHELLRDRQSTHILVRQALMNRHNVKFSEILLKAPRVEQRIRMLVALDNKAGLLK